MPPLRDGSWPQPARSQLPPQFLQAGSTQNQQLSSVGGSGLRGAARETGIKGKNFPFKALYYNFIIVLWGNTLPCPGAVTRKEARRCFCVCVGEDAVSMEQGGRKDWSWHRAAPCSLGVLPAFRIAAAVNMAASVMQLVCMAGKPRQIHPDRQSFTKIPYCGCSIPCTFWLRSDAQHGPGSEACWEMGLIFCWEIIQGAHKQPAFCKLNTAN